MLFTSIYLLYPYFYFSINTSYLFIIKKLLRLDNLLMLYLSGSDNPWNLPYPGLAEYLFHFQFEEIL